MCIVLNKKEGASCITTHLLFYNPNKPKKIYTIHVNNKSSLFFKKQAALIVIFDY